MSFYDVLGVAQDAEAEVIAAAYRALAKKYHPDVNRSPDATDRLRSLNEAYDTLADPEARQAYDASIRNDRQAAGAKRLNQDQDTPMHDVVACETKKLGQAQSQTSVLGDAIYVLIGIPIFWTLAVFLADILLFWIIMVFLDWAGPGDYSLSQAFQSLVEAATMRYNQVMNKEPLPQNIHESMISMMLSAAWMYICTGAATGAVISYTREERPRVSIWVVLSVILSYFCFLCYRRWSIIDETATQDFYIANVLVFSAIFAGIVYGFRSEIKQRGQAAPDEVILAVQ